MPTKPEGAHLTSLRTWFAGVISEFKAGGRCDFLDFDNGLDTMLKHAATLGLPKGTLGKHGVLALVGPGGVVSFGGAAEPDQTETLLALSRTPNGQRTGRTNGGRPDGERPENACDVCDSWHCQAHTPR